MIRSLLAAIDLSPGSDRVIGRVAQLPLAEGARVTLLHVVPRGLPERARQRAESDARRALQTEAKFLARALPPRSEVQQVVKVGAAAAEIARSAGAAKAELIVMGRAGGRALREIFLGSTAERVIRQGQRPVLVVRLPARTPYVRPALALELDHAAPEALALLLRVIPPPRPRVDVIHAYEAPYPGLIYPSLSGEDTEDYRDHYRQKALRELAKVLPAELAQARSSPGDGLSWKTHVQRGGARTVIEKIVRKSNTDLLVLGTRGRAGVAHAFLGTVAGDVLRSVACDVLVVPPRREAPGAT
jgi:nucleotide-binding universal stress UspA family protein